MGHPATTQGLCGAQGLSLSTYPILKGGLSGVDLEFCLGTPALLFSWWSVFWITFRHTLSSQV